MAGAEDRFQDYQVYDRNYEKVGKVDDLFVNDRDEPEYIGVKTGFLGMKSTLVPMEAVRVNDGRELVEISADKDAIEDGPSFDSDDDITPDFERRVRNHYGLGDPTDTGDRAAYGAYYATETTGDDQVDLQPGERAGGSAEAGYAVEERLQTSGEDVYDYEQDRQERVAPAEPADGVYGDDRERPVRQEGVGEGRGGSEDAEELRVERMEEELTAGVREREAGRVNVRKRVRTDREQLRVPKRREEVTVERVPVDEGDPGRTGTSGGGASTTDENDIVIPIVEEEVVVEKRPVVKEELRIRKRVVEEEEIVEEDVRKEEVDVSEETDRRDA